MNKIVFFLLLLFVVGCARKNYVEHKVKLEKVSDNCKDQQSYFRLNSNFGGERYEFEKCLPATFSDADVSSVRKGDTVVVNFKKSTGTANVVYHVTLDIDSYPAYSYMHIDGETYTVSQAKK